MTSAIETYIKSINERGISMCFRPPELNKMMTQCPSCKGFNPPKLTKCKKCGADLPKPEAEKK